ncbi:hypothetical protein [Aurantiacibacter zhengii]|uniref:Membrane protein YkvI n=1 Tax=Aurantiacibacter zhengii TaxID=2307003 RepID=A0A418NQJ5_9SPHN|nr:hypothetical protein [Aurantiacibacter zhengii]RIV84996.1 hypothetical protein D2V07_11860 [Aurantiacibacter zhengii]
MSDGATAGGNTFFRRYLLPALALKGVIIGGGYATGRELAEYFLSQGPTGALLAMAVATVMWSIVAALTFALAFHMQAFDYRAFIEKLLGPAAIVFELCFIAFCILLLAVFGAAAGEVVASLFPVPPWVGTVLLALVIALVAGAGEAAVETMFKVVSCFLYAVYALFLVLALTRFGGPIGETLAAGGISPEWPVSGITYGIYNIVAAVMILPLLTHFTSRRNAAIAGVIAGPMAMLPALAFLIAMTAFYPDILGATLPSDYILQRLDSPAFRFVFQIMVLGALLESGVGVIHALNERALHLHAKRHPDKPAPRWFRPGLTVAVLVGCMFAATAIGLVDLIASGYRLMALVFLFTFVIPLLTVGVLRLRRPASGGKISPRTDTAHV